MLLVVVAGIPRSGSTWMFNAVKAILETQEQAVVSQWIEEKRPFSAEAVNLVKVHAPDSELKSEADIVLSSFRDLRDIAASVIAMGWADEGQALGTIDAIRLAHDFWSSGSVLDVPYEVLKENPFRIVKALASAMGIRLTDCKVSEVVSSIPHTAKAIGPGGYDPVSLLHERHVNDGTPGRWRYSLSEKLAAGIWLRHSDWLATHGYAEA